MRQQRVSDTETRVALQVYAGMREAGAHGEPNACSPFPIPLASCSGPCEISKCVSSTASAR